jgi:TonB family protein
MAIARTMQSSTRTVGFVGLSGFLHIALIVSITLFAGEFIHKPENPPVTEIEIITPPPPASSSNERVERPTEALAPSSQTVLPAKANDVAVVKASARRDHAKHTVAKVKTFKPAAAVAPRASQIQTPVHQEVEAPNFETAELEEAPAIAVPSFDEGLIADDLAYVEQDTNRQTQAQLQALRNEADEQQEKINNEHSEAVAELERKNQQDSEKMAAILAAQRNSEKEALNKALAEQAAREKAETDARARASAAALTANAKKGNGGGPSKISSGAGEIRGIQDLRQKPGNKRPKYESEDRLLGRQGEVVFVAYVTKEGSLTNFKIVRSSGHRNLDYKTLKALKDWKFYSGQEGSVEIPFQWDLKGGPQEMPTGLRTKVSQSTRPADLRNN